MAEVTLNKDGSPRKKGSGKTKGAGCFTKIKWSELREYVGENVPIPISRVWLRSLGVPVDEGKPEASTKTTEESVAVEGTETVEAIDEPVEETPEAAEEIPEPSEEASEPGEAIDEPVEETPEATEEIPEPSEEASEPGEAIDEAEKETPEPVDETEDEKEEEEDSPPIGAVTPPYRYAQDFDL